MSLLDDYVGAKSDVVAAQTAKHGDSNGLAMFKVDPVALPGSLDIIHAAVRNNILIIALVNNKLLRIDLLNPAEIQDLEVPRFKNNESGSVRKVYLDDTGHHILAATDKGAIWYLHTKLTKPARLKSKGLLESVAWNPAGTPFATRDILLGLGGGSVVETWLEPIEGFNKSVERYSKQVHSLDSGEAVTGIAQYFGKANKSRQVLLTSQRAVQHFGGTVNATGDSAGLTLLFSSSPMETQALETSMEHTSMAIVKDPGDESSLYYAWTSSSGIMHGPAPTSAPGPESFENIEMLNPGPFLTSTSDVHMVLSAYHILLLHDNTIHAYNRFDSRKVYEEHLASLDKLCGMISDPIQQTYWLFSRTELYEIVITDEKQHMWEIYLERRDYDAALKHSSNRQQTNEIYATQAEAQLAIQNYSTAAEVFAKSDTSVELVALKFLDLGEREALRLYLLRKLDTIKKNQEMQRLMLATWVMELFLAKLTALDDLQNNLRTNVNHNSELEDLKQQYSVFVTKYKNDLDRDATYTLINSYGRKDELLVYSEAIKDYKYVVDYYIGQDKHEEALALLIKHPNVELAYASSTILLSEAPKETVEMWMRLQTLDPARLLPAILSSNNSHRSIPVSENQAIRYLQFVVKHQNNTDPCVHNALLGIYARDSGKDESELLEYLQKQGSNVCYDLDFGLRQCKQYNRVICCVHIYCIMGLFDQAVLWALEHDNIPLASSVADRVEDDTSLRKKLWLLIAKKTISRPGGVKAAIDMSKENDLLRIEDLVPHFDDLTVIDDFKDEICTALEGYTKNIETLRQEMDESSRTAETIKQNIVDLKKRFAIIQIGEECYHCHRPLLERPFYVFPCQHTFHSDCMIQLALKNAAAYQKRRITQLQAQIARLSATTGVQTSSTVNRAASKTGSGSSSGPNSLTIQLEKLRDELDDIVAGECLLCGRLMIRSIDEGFLSTDDRLEAAEAASWQI